MSLLGRNSSQLGSHLDVDENQVDRQDRGWEQLHLVQSSAQVEGGADEYAGGGQEGGEEDQDDWFGERMMKRMEGEDQISESAPATDSPPHQK